MNRIGTLAQISNVGRVTLTAAVVLALAGCAGHGTYTQEHLERSRLRQNLLKSEIQAQMANQQYLAGDLEKALKSVDNAIEMNEESAEMHVLRGRILLELGSLEQSRLAFVKATTLNPKNVDAAYFQGILSERAGKTDDAITHYQQAMTIDPANPQYVIAAAEMLIQRKDTGAAKDLLSSRGTDFAQNAGFRQLQGQIAMLEKQYARGADLLMEARLLSPDDLNIQEELARAQMFAKRFGEAQLTLQQLLKTKNNENRRDLRMMQTRCLMALDRLGEARSALIALTNESEGANDVQSWFDLGQVCVRLGDQQRVRIAASRLVAMAPERSEGYLLRAMHHRMNQQLQPALEAVNKAVSISPKDPTGYSLRALITQQLGNIEQSRQDQAKAIALSGEFEGGVVSVPTE